MGKRAAALMVCAVIAGCGGGGSERPIVDALAKLPKCSSWDGKVVSAKTWGDGCLRTAEDVALAGDDDCPDGRQLWWNDWGWGYAGEKAHHHERADGQLVPPDVELNACE